MIRFARSRVALKWVLAVVLILGSLGLVGALIWHYPGWPFSLVLISGLIADNVLRRSANNHRRDGSLASSHPQDNDPNRR